MICLLLWVFSHQSWIILVCVICVYRVTLDGVRVLAIGIDVHVGLTNVEPGNT